MLLIVGHKRYYSPLVSSKRAKHRAASELAGDGSAALYSYRAPDTSKQQGMELRLQDSPAASSGFGRLLPYGKKGRNLPW